MTDPQHLAVLRSSRLFDRTSPEDLAALAARGRIAHFRSGQFLHRPEMPATDLGIILEGKARLARVHRDEDVVFGLLEAGDHFGEGTILGQRLPYSLRAEGEVSALLLDPEACADLARRDPAWKDDLRLSANSRRAASRHSWPWLEPEETVHVAARRTRYSLLEALGFPALVGFVSLAGLLVLLAYEWRGLIYLLPAAGILVSIFGVAWAYLDWINDQYVVTNRRIVRIERLPLIYEDRQEVPLRMILAVEIATSALRSLLGFGDVLIRTFTRPVTFESIPLPHRVAAAVEEQIRRDKERQEKEGRERIEQSLGERLGVPATLGEPTTSKSAAEGAGAFGPNPLKVRYQVGDTIIYRKDYYFLVNDLALPGFITIFGALLAVLAFLNAVSIPPFLLGAIAAVLLLTGLLWMLYEYVDWANDLYQVTPEQIIALHRTPLGREDRRAASLDNILSLEYDRPGPLARLMNFGTVAATIGNVRFTFDQVHDPVGVQEDIYRRMEAHRARTLEEERLERSEQIAEWLEAYDDVVRKRKNGDGQGG